MYIFSKVITNRSWMNTKCLSEAYEKGVDEFIQYAFVKLHPCVKCLNVDP
jgi:hypothetical protein